MTRGRVPMSNTPKSLLRGRTQGHPVKAATHLPVKAGRKRPLSHASRLLTLVHTPPVAGYNSSSAPGGAAGGQGVLHIIAASTCPSHAQAPGRWDTHPDLLCGALFHLGLTNTTHHRLLLLVAKQNNPCSTTCWALQRAILKRDPQEK